MTTAETIAEIKDIVVIVFLVVALVVLFIGSIMSLRLYSRANRFMDRIETVADSFEETFSRVVAARQVVEEAASALKPVARGLGLVGAFSGIVKIFGRRSTKTTEPEEKAS
tara:strand:+ start:885 stop:1217 length:333 start_codon:yes stop_codon:yes gene_type:complete